MSELTFGVQFRIRLPSAPFFHSSCFPKVASFARRDRLKCITCAASHQQSGAFWTDTLAPRQARAYRKTESPRKWQISSLFISMWMDVKFLTMKMVFLQISNIFSYLAASQYSSCFRLFVSGRWRRRRRALRRTSTYLRKGRIQGVATGLEPKIID